MFLYKVFSLYRSLFLYFIYIITCLRSYLTIYFAYITFFANLNIINTICKIGFWFYTHVHVCVHAHVFACASSLPIPFTFEDPWTEAWILNPKKCTSQDNWLVMYQAIPNCISCLSNVHLIAISITFVLCISQVTFYL